jgi:ABC-type transporter Mla MlaB component
MQSTFSLPSELSVYTVGELGPKWLEWLSHVSVVDGAQAQLDDGFRVDAAAVGEVDAAGVQLLLSLSNALARSQRSLQLLNPSQPLADACAALGVSHLLVDAQHDGDAS